MLRNNTGASVTTCKRRDSDVRSGALEGAEAVPPSTLPTVLIWDSIPVKSHCNTRSYWATFSCRRTSTKIMDSCLQMQCIRGGTKTAREEKNAWGQLPSAKHNPHQKITPCDLLGLKS